MKLLVVSFCILLAFSGKDILSMTIFAKSCSFRVSAYYDKMRQCLAEGKLAVYKSFECSSLLDRKSCEKEGGRLVFDPICLAATCEEDGCSEEKPYLLSNGSCINRNDCPGQRVLFNDYRGISECICDFREDMYAVGGHCYKNRFDQGLCSAGEVMVFHTEQTEQFSNRTIRLPLEDAEYTCCSTQGGKESGNSLCGPIKEEPFIRVSVGNCEESSESDCLTEEIYYQNIQFVRERLFDEK